MTAEQVLEKIELTLPKAVPPIATYVPIRQIGNLLYVSGQAAFRDGNLVYKGKLGKEISIEEGYEAAKIAAINILAILKEYLGSLDRIKSVVKVNGYVACTSDFLEHPKVINGASDLLAEIFGENGCHARTAIGQASLPFDTPVEVEAIFEV